MTRTRIESLMVRYAHGVLFNVARPLKSLNKNRGWQMEHWESQAWEKALRAALEVQSSVLDLGELVAWMPPPTQPIAAGRMARVIVRRLVPSLRNFTRDADNLAFLVKPLNDALKRCAFIPADTRKALEQPLPIESVSIDRKFWTQIFISPVPPALRSHRREP